MKNYKAEIDRIFFTILGDMDFITQQVDCQGISQVELDRQELFREAKKDLTTLFAEFTKEVVGETEDLWLVPDHPELQTGKLNTNLSPEEYIKRSARNELRDEQNARLKKMLGQKDNGTCSVCLGLDDESCDCEHCNGTGKEPLVKGTHD